MDRRKDGRMDLCYRTLPATAGGPIKKPESRLAPFIVQNCKTILTANPPQV